MIDLSPRGQASAYVKEVQETQRIFYERLANALQELRTKVERGSVDDREWETDELKLELLPPEKEGEAGQARLSYKGILAAVIEGMFGS